MKIYKITIYLSLVLISIISNSNYLFAQNNVGIGTTTPDASSILELNSTTSGFLPPRMTTAQRNAISNPATGLYIWNSDNIRYEFNAGTPGVPNWTAIITGSTIPLNNQFIFVGNASNVATGVVLSGDATITNAGVITISNNAITTAKILNNAVDGTKINLSGNATGDMMYYNGTDWVVLVPGTSGFVLGSNGSGNLPTWKNPTSLETDPVWAAATFNAPLSRNTNIVSITQANGTTNGYLSSGDWTTFNNKQGALTIGNVTTTTSGVTITGGTGAVIGSGSTINIATANGSTTGLLSSGDWTTFNNKQGALTIGDVTTTTSGVTITGGTGAVIGAGSTINIATANGTNTGLLSNTDWTTFNNKENALTFSAPLSRAVNTISLPQSNGSTNGYLSSGDWTTFNNKQGALTIGNVTTTTSGITITGGTGAVIGSGSTINIATANGTNTGLLSNTDWTTFNNKQGALTIGDVTTTTTGVTITGGTGAVIGSGSTINIATANGTNTGLLSNTDWTTFNNKLNALTTGDITTSTSGVTITGGTGAVIGAGSTINIANANNINTGLLTSSDWSTFNSKENALTFSAPLIRTLNNITISKADGTTNGYLSSGDWTTFNNKLSSEVDGIIGNEVTNATTSEGLIRAGTGTTIDPYTLGIDIGGVSTTKIADNAVTGAKIDLAGNTNGDMMYYNGTDWVRFPVGSDNQILTLNGTVPNWENNAASLPSGTDKQTLRFNGTTLEATSSMTNDGTSIGIGITGATAKLHQDGGDATATFHKFTAGTTTGTTVSDGFNLGIDASGNAVINQYENLNLYINTNNTERMRIWNDGQIGINYATSFNDSIKMWLEGDMLINGDLIVTGNIDPISITLIPQASAPVGAVKGTVYYNNSTNSLQITDGTSFSELGSQIKSNIDLKNTDDAAKELRLYERSSEGNDYTAFKAQDQDASVTYTLPAADGTNGQVLTTDGSGNLSWETPAGGGSSVPSGSMMMWPTATPPSGWLLCYGQEISRVTYAALFALLGTTYGAGDGTTTFKLPDLRGRMPLGADNMGGTSANRVLASEADNLGQGAGEENHTLTTSEMPSHTHTLRAYNTSSADQKDPVNKSLGKNSTIDDGIYRNSDANVDMRSTSITNTGGDGAHNNMPPYMTINYIIKY